MKMFIIFHLHGLTPLRNRVLRQGGVGVPLFSSPFDRFSFATAAPAVRPVALCARTDRDQRWAADGHGLIVRQERVIVCKDGKRFLRKCGLGFLRWFEIHRLPGAQMRGTWATPSSGVNSDPGTWATPCASLQPRHGVGANQSAQKSVPIPSGEGMGTLLNSMARKRLCLDGQSGYFTATWTFTLRSREEPPTHSFRTPPAVTHCFCAVDQY